MKNFGVRILGSFSLIVSLMFTVGCIMTGVRDILGFTLAISGIVSGVGLLMLRNWARQLFIMQMGLLVVGEAWHLYNQIFVYPFSGKLHPWGVKDDFFHWGGRDGPLIGLTLIFIYFICYLMHPNIKKQFK